MNQGLRDVLDDAGFEARLADNLAQLETLAVEIDTMAAADAIRDHSRPRLARPSSSLLFGMAA